MEEVGGGKQWLCQGSVRLDNAPLLVVVVDWSIDVMSCPVMSCYAMGMGG